MTPSWNGFELTHSTESLMSHKITLNSSDLTISNTTRTMRSTQEAKSMCSRPCVLWFSLLLVVAQVAASRVSVHAQAGQATPAESAQAASYAPSAANLASRQAFQDSKFGLFIHWGVYSVLGDGEWVMNNKKMTIAEYEKLPPA